MKLRAALKLSEELAKSFDIEINGLSIPATDRVRLSASLLDQTHEHHKAIRLLIAEGLIGSAFSLARILFETMIRGVWLLRCAKDQDVERFMSDKLDMPLREIITTVENYLGTSCGVLTRVRRDYWSALCSYAHGGYLQAVRRNTPKHITPSYEEDEILEVVSFADFCFFVAALEILDLSSNPDLVEKWAARFPVNVPAA